MNELNTNNKVTLLSKFLWYKKFRNLVKVHNLPLAVSAGLGLSFYGAQISNILPRLDYPIFHNQQLLDFICFLTGLVCLQASAGSEILASMIFAVALAYLLEFFYRMESPKSKLLRSLEEKATQITDSIPLGGSDNEISAEDKQKQLIEANIKEIQKADKGQ